MSRLRLLLAVAACLPVQPQAQELPQAVAERIDRMHDRWVFADMHAHPSRFHRANVESIEAEEIERYRRNRIDLVVASISSDMAYSGRYTHRDGTEIGRGRYKPAAGEVFALSMDRLERIGKTIRSGYAVHAATPASVVAARESGDVAILPALEGGDALEGDIRNLRILYDEGLRLVQLVHFRNNELGHMQTWPYSPGGLTDFGREVVAESNRLGIVIDIAHANSETMRDVLAASTDPVIFSHGGVRRYTDDDRAVTDEEIRLIAANGGVVGIWPNGAHIENVAEMVDYIEHVIDVGGVDHVGIGSDLRGMSSYATGFDSEANFRAIAAELLVRGHTDDDIGRVMGGNFFRVFEKVAGIASLPFR